MFCVYNWGVSQWIVNYQFAEMPDWKTMVLRYLVNYIFFTGWTNFFIVLNSCAMNVIDKNILTVKSSVIWVLCNFAKELQSRAEYPNCSKERKLYHQHGMVCLTLTPTENKERFKFKNMSWLCRQKIASCVQL